MCDFKVYYQYLLFCTIVVIVQSVRVYGRDSNYKFICLYNIITYPCLAKSPLKLRHG